MGRKKEGMGEGSRDGSCSCKYFVLNTTYLHISLILKLFERDAKR